MLRDYLKLVRLPNLIVMALVQILLYECVLKSILLLYNQVPALSPIDLIYLILSQMVPNIRVIAREELLFEYPLQIISVI